MLADETPLETLVHNTGTTSHMFNISIEADPLSVRAALRSAIARFIRQISEDEAGTLELVLAEVMNNIVEHSYGDGETGTIELSIVRDRRGLSCSLTDNGTPLPADHLLRNITDQPRPTPDNLPEGGFGWFLIRDLAEDLGYFRDGSRNLLAFRLPIKASL
jgi:serine/threonine-protein kinase RsbW